MNTRHSTFVTAVLGWALSCLACGAAAAPDAEPPLRLELPAAAGHDDWRAHAAAALHAEQQAAQVAALSIVVLPPEGVPGTPGAQRVRHALSVRSEAPQRMLRSIGFEASDCATRFRVPTKLRQGGGGVGVNVRAHIGLACRF